MPIILSITRYFQVRIHLFYNVVDKTIWLGIRSWFMNYLDMAKSQLLTESVLFCREVFHNILQFISLNCRMKENWGKNHLGRRPALVDHAQFFLLFTFSQYILQLTGVKWIVEKNRPVQWHNWTFSTQTLLSHLPSIQSQNSRSYIRSNQKIIDDRNTQL